MDEVEDKEREERDVLLQPPETTAPGATNVLDPDLTSALGNYDPSDPFWATLDFDSGTT